MEIRKKIPEILGQKKVVFISLALTVATTVAINRIDRTIAQDGMGAFYLQTAFDVLTYKSILASWGKSGISLFLSTLWLDYLYSIFYSFMLASAICVNSLQIRQLVSQPTNYPWWAREKMLWVTVLLIFGGTIATFTSNTIHYIIIQTQQISSFNVKIAAFMAFLRYTAIAYSLMIILLQMTSRKRIYRDNRNR